MWPAAHHLSIRASDADALFVSALQRSDDPSVGQIRQAIAAAIGAFDYSGCAERVAHVACQGDGTGFLPRERDRLAS